MDFWNVFDDYYRPVRKYIFNLVRDEWKADDLTQETFLTAKLKIEQLKDETKIKPWIFSIARNQCLDHFRLMKTRHPSVDLQGEAELIPIESLTHFKLEQDQMSRCVQDKMLQLTSAQREILVLFDVMEFSNQEIAELLGLTVNNVKVRLHRARKALKNILEQECSFEYDERNVMVCLPKPAGD